jgi:hypothetical protein
MSIRGIIRGIRGTEGLLEYRVEPTPIERCFILGELRRVPQIAELLPNWKDIADASQFARE